MIDEGHRQDLMESLQYRAIDARYATIRTAHTRTCRWLLEKTEYQDWLDINKTTVHHGFLWIRGKPGSGKSTLMKFAVGNARKALSETVISFFFNARGEDLEKSTLGMYQSLLFQLLKAIPDLQAVLDRIRPTFLHEKIYRWEIHELQSLFEAAIRNLGQRRLTCFIDALDECEEGQIRDLVAFLEQLGQLATSSQVHFHVCLSSRHYPYISISNGMQLTLEGQEGHDQDISRYLSSELKAGRGKQVEAIKEEILRRSSGIFLWVVLVVQILNKEYDHGRVHALWKRLREIPDGLDKLFEEILTRDQQNMEELVLCLQWILYAKHPLKREELYHAVLSGAAPEALSGSNIEDTTAHDMERFILSCSKGLAETTKRKAQTVQFIHESVRDFLLGKNGLNKLKAELRLGPSHDRLKQCCYEYMASDTSEYLPPSMVLPSANSEEAKNLRELVSQKFPFLEYAVRNVLYHADVAISQGISPDAFMETFNLGKWIMLDNVFEKYQVRRHTPKASLLYIVAEKNLSSLVRTQVESNVFPGATDKKERYAAPLYAALANVNVNEKTIEALFSIPAARTYDSGEVCKEQSDCEIERNRAAIALMIEKRPNLDSGKGESLMDWAASNGHEAVVKLLLGRDDIDPNSHHNRSLPLFSAVKEGHAAVVRLLLARVDLYADHKNQDGQSPVLSAVERREEAAIKTLLIRHNIDPNIMANFYSTLLLLAAERGHEAVVKSLLAKDDVEVNHKNQYSQTSLSLAALHGHEAVVKLLLARDDVDLNSKDSSSQTPLLIAAERGDEAVVKLLLARDDVDLNSKDSRNQTPLLLAAERGHEAVVKLLLARDDVDLDLNSKDWNNQTPLLLAAERGHEAVVKLLLARDDVDLDLNSKDWNNQTPLLLAAERGHEAVVKLLLARDNVDINSEDDFQRTPLSRAVMLGRKSIVKLLLERDDTELHHKDKFGETPLLLAIRFGKEPIIKLLQAKINSDPKYKDDSGQSSSPIGSQQA